MKILCRACVLVVLVLFISAEVKAAGSSGPSSPGRYRWTPAHPISRLDADLFAETVSASTQLGLTAYKPAWVFDLVDFRGDVNGHIVVGRSTFLAPDLDEVRDCIWERLVSEKSATWEKRLSELLPLFDDLYVTYYLGPFSESTAVHWVTKGIPLPMVYELLLRRHVNDTGEIVYDDESLSFSCPSISRCFVVVRSQENMDLVFDARKRTFLAADKYRMVESVKVDSCDGNSGSGDRGSGWYPDVPDLQQYQFNCLACTGCDPEDNDCGPVAAANVLKYYANSNSNYSCLGVGNVCCGDDCNSGDSGLVDSLRYYMDWDAYDDGFWDPAGTWLYSIDNGIEDTCEVYSTQLSFTANPSNHIFTTYNTFKNHIIETGPLLIAADDNFTVLQAELDWAEKSLSTSGHIMTVIGYDDDSTDWLILRDVTPLSSATAYYNYDDYGGGDGSVRIWPGGSCPSGVEVHQVLGTAHSGFVEIRWQADLEDQNAGWNIQRTDKIGGEFKQINGDIIPPYQYSYSYIDASVESGHVYYYRLEAADLDGSTQKYDHVWAIPNGIDQDLSQRVDGLDLIIASQAGERVGLTADVEVDSNVDRDKRLSEWKKLFARFTASPPLNPAQDEGLDLGPEGMLVEK